MKIAVLGTGMVGQTLARKLAELGHQVTMGSRQAGSEKAAAFAQETGQAEGAFADAAQEADLIFLAVKGEVAKEVLAAAGAEALRGKPVVDITNRIVFGTDGRPAMYEASPGGRALAEELQDAYPDTRILKCLNTLWAGLMVDPGQLAAGDHNVFMAGNDAAAKQALSELLQSFGWKPEAILDTGDIVTARGLEAYLVFWLTLFIGGGQNPKFNIKVVR